MALSNNMRRTSRILAWIVLAGIALIPVDLFLNFFPQSVWGVPLTHVDAFIARAPADARLAAMVLAALPAGLTAYAWWSAYRLLLLYGKGEVFSAEALHWLYRIALALLLVAIAGFFVNPVITLLMTWNTGWNRIGTAIVPGFSPDLRTLMLSIRVGGGHALNFTLGTQEVSALFKAALVYVVAKAMEDAGRATAENAAFV